MPRDIPILQMPPSSGGVLIKRAQLRQQRQSLDLLAASRRQAAKTVKQAQAEAEQIRQQAYQAGYEEGVLSSAAAVADFLTQRQQLAAELQKRVSEHARRLLSSALNQPELLLELVDEWLAASPAGTPSQQLEIVAPESARKFHARIKDKLHSCWPGNFIISYHEEKRFVIKHADQLAEFNVDKFLNDSLSILTKLEELPDECRRLNENSIQQLEQIFSHYSIIK